MEKSASESSSPSINLFLDESAISYLKEACRWARFLSILGFIGIGMILLVALFMGNFVNNYNKFLPPALSMGGSMMFFFIAAIYFFPVLYLYRFSEHMKKAIVESNAESLNRSFENLKSLFRYVGIFTVVIISINLIGFVSAIVFDLFRSR